MRKIVVNDKGVKNRLKDVKPYRSFAEYIWNGFDAGANIIDIDFQVNEMGGIHSLTIKDNGKGIPHKLLDPKFEPVLSSEKRDTEIKHTLIHGKNGLGRLTFYHFAQSIEWHTCYKNKGSYFKYIVSVNGENIDQYSGSEAEKVSGSETGTKVVFNNLFDLSEDYVTNILMSFLRKEFAWFLELKQGQDFVININGKALDYESLVKDRDTFEIKSNNIIFKASYVRWSNKLNRHFSRYYCTSSDGDFKYSQPTTLNNKGDEFYHSVFVTSEYFNKFHCEKKEKQENCLGTTSDKSEDFERLVSGINSFLKDKRKPFIINYAKSLVEGYESNKVFPDYDASNKWEVMKSNDLKEAVKQLYQVEPKIFSHLNVTQKKTFVSFLALIIEGGDVDDLFKVLDGVVDLSSTERELFARQLKTTQMSSIVHTIELISDRYKSVEEFKKLVFDPKMYAGEVPHLQRMMEKTYWLIGEEYQLLTAAEPKFEEALRRQSYILSGDTEKKKLEHPEKNREMDLFLIRQGKRSNKIENIVLELKHPVNVRLGKKEVDQVYRYFQVIKSDSRFNGSNMDWKFYLIGNKFDSTEYVQSQIESLKSHGEPGLIFIGDYKLYAFKWSEIFTEFELKHDFLNEKLNLEIERLSAGEHLSADDIVESTRSSDSPKEIIVPPA